jgi:TRAP-type C4-dicarboxylate transport system permease small subunit
MGGGVFAALQTVADRIASAATWAAAACLAALLLLVLAEIVLGLLSRVTRVVPGSIGFAWEYSAYLMGAAFMLGTGMTLRAGMHVRVELLLGWRGGRAARVCEIAAAAIGAAFALVLAWAMLRFALQAFHYDQRSSESFTPLWIPQAALAAGAIVLAMQMVARFLAALIGAPLEDRSLGVATLPE